MLDRLGHRPRVPRQIATHLQNWTSKWSAGSGLCLVTSPALGNADTVFKHSWCRLTCPEAAASPILTATGGNGCFNCFAADSRARHRRAEGGCRTIRAPAMTPSNLRRARIGHWPIRAPSQRTPAALDRRAGRRPSRQARCGTAGALASRQPTRRTPPPKPKVGTMQISAPPEDARDCHFRRDLRRRRNHYLHRSPGPTERVPAPLSVQAMPGLKMTVRRLLLKSGQSTSSRNLPVGDYRLQISAIGHKGGSQNSVSWKLTRNLLADHFGAARKIQPYAGNATPRSCRVTSPVFQHLPASRDPVPETAWAATPSSRGMWGNAYATRTAGATV